MLKCVCVYSITTQSSFNPRLARLGRGTGRSVFSSQVALNALQSFYFFVRKRMKRTRK